MSRRFRVFRQRPLWRLLCGVLGGVAGVGDGLAAGSAGSAVAGGASMESQALSLTLALGNTRKPARRPISPRAAHSAVDLAPPLRLTLSLAVRSGGAPPGPGAPVPQRSALAVAPSGSPRGTATSGRAAQGGDNPKAPARRIGGDGVAPETRPGNSGLSVADGGRVVIGTQGSEAVQTSVLNKDGIIRAQSFESRNGEVWLGGGDSAGGGVSVTGVAIGAAAAQGREAAKLPGDKAGLSGQSIAEASGVGVAPQRAPSPRTRETAEAILDPAALRLTLGMSGRPKPVRPTSPVRAARPDPPEIAPSLRLALSLAVRPGGVPSGSVTELPRRVAQTSVDTRGGSPNAAVAPGSAAQVSATARGGSLTSAAAATGRFADDDDSAGLPAPEAGIEAAALGSAPRRAPSPVDRSATGASGSAESRLPSLEGEVWQMAPIRWTGNTGTLGSTFSGGDSSSLNLTNTLNITANSFIVAPWLGKWSGSFGRSSATGLSTGVGIKNKSQSTSNNFSGIVNLLPNSEFPFSAHFSHGMSEGRGGGSTSEGGATTIGLTQKYRTNGGRDNYSARYGRSILRSGQERSVSSSMGADYSTWLEFPYEHILEGRHSLNAAVDFVPQTATSAGAGQRQLGGNVSHDWKVHEDLSINSRLQMRNSRLELLQGNALQRNNSTILIGSSNFSWRPSEGELSWLPFEYGRLSLSGGASASSTQTDTGTGTPLISQQVFTGSLGGGYVFNKNLTAGASVSGSMSSSDGGRFSILNANANANYSGDALKLGSFDYSWGIGGGLGAGLANPGTTSTNAGFSGNHSLNRTIVIDPSQSVGLNASQGLSVNLSQGAGATSTTTSLSNAAGANWTARYGEALSGSVSANVNHSVNFGTSTSQSFATTLAGSSGYVHHFSARASGGLSGSISWSGSMIGNVQSQTLNQVTVGGWQGSLAGNVQASYKHIAPFSVPNLHYGANLIWTFAQSAAGGGDAGAAALNSSTSLQQNLTYRIGRLSFNANAAVINVGARTSYSIFGSVNREFSGFFDGRW